MQVHAPIAGARATAARLATEEVGWFAVSQPGVLGFLDDRFRGEVFQLALEAAWYIVAAFHQAAGVPPPRVRRSALNQAEKTIIAEMAGAVPLNEGCAARQPELMRWVARLVADPPVNIDSGKSRALGIALAAVICAFDESGEGQVGLREV